MATWDCQKDNSRVDVPTGIDHVCDVLPVNLGVGLDVHDPVWTELERFL